MNTSTVVPRRLICSRCKHMVTGDAIRIGEECTRQIETASMGIITCGGEYHLTKGYQFRQLHGYSKTLKRNMRKHGLDPIQFSDSINAYRKIRRDSKKAERVRSQEKHRTKKALRKAPKDAAKRGSA